MSRGSHLDALRLLASVGSAHWRALMIGTLATLGVVAMRLALPWPLRGVVENVFPPVAGGATPLGAGYSHPVLLFCAVYFLLSIGTGSFEWMQRVWMARTASQTTHDLRGLAVSMAGRATTLDRADLITRIIGDSARLKAGLKGILIHLTQNALLLLAITGLFLVLAPRLGLLFLTSGVLAALIGYLTVEEVAETTWRQRKKEARYASTIQAEPIEIRDDGRRALNRSSARKEVRITRIIGRSTLLIHAAVAATLGLAFWIGVQDVRAGSLAPGELFLFIAYALTIQRRAVMIGRQVARGGKVLANAERIGRLISSVSAEPPKAAPLATELRMEAVKLRPSTAQTRGARLGPLDLTIARGDHLLVLGGDGAGKSSLLAVLAGRLPVRRGRLLWDGRDVASTPERIRSEVSYLPEDTAFSGVSARDLLGLADGSSVSAENQAVLEKIGAWRVVRRLTEGLDQSVAAGGLSRRQRRALALGGVLLGASPVWVLDEPVDGTGTRSRRSLETVLERAGGRTLVVSLRAPLMVDRFDRVVVLRRGKIDFQGSPAEWRARRERIREIRRA